MNQIPAALKVFGWSLVVGVAGGYAAFEATFWLVTRLVERVNPVLASGLAMLAALSVGTAAAVTAGVVAGKRLQP